jgi:hypothetical protein
MSFWKAFNVAGLVTIEHRTKCCLMEYYVTVFENTRKAGDAPTSG